MENVNQFAEILDSEETLPQADEDSKASDNGDKEPLILFTEMGNAIRFIRANAKDVRHCSALGWLIWDGKRWEREAKKGASELMKNVTHELIKESNALLLTGNTEEAEKTFKWAAASQNSNKIKGALSLAESDPAVSVKDANDFDSHKYLLNVLNGTLNLKTGELLSHNRAGLITKLVNVEHDSKAKCPEFLKFIERIVPDVAVRGFLQRWLGYNLTGDAGEHKFVILWGDGANGKTTLVELFRLLLGGGYADSQVFGAFLLNSRHSETRHEFAGLKGTRMLIATEGGEGAVFDEPLIKRLTGSDAFRTRFMYHEFFTFVPEFKITLCTNFKPVILGQDEAIWRRVCLVPFEVQIPEDEQEKNLHLHLLEEEASGILNWALEGLQDYRDFGLAPPETVRLATRNYREESDVVGHFLEEKCDIGDDFSVTVAELYKAYLNWAKENGHKHPFSKIRFGKGLDRKGFKPDQGGGGVRYRQGLRLKLGVW